MDAGAETDDGDTDRAPRRLIAVAIVVGVAAVGLVVGLRAITGSEDRIAASASLVDDDSMWTTGTGSGESLAVLAERLLAEADDAGCGDAPPPSSRCAGLLRSAARGDISARVGAYRQYLQDFPEGEHAELAEAGIARADMEREAGAWADAAQILADSGASTEQRVAALDQYLASFPDGANAASARRTRGELLAAWVARDWESTRAAVASAGRDRARALDALASHLRRVGVHATPVHRRQVERQQEQIRDRWDDERYTQLKQWFEGNPQAADKIAEGFAGYLRDFPDGRHRKAARDFVDWWKQLQRPKAYQLEVQALRLNKRKLGSTQDKPEVYVVVSSGRTNYRTGVAKQGYSPIWSGQRFKLTWKPGQPVRIVIWDKDLRWDDKLAAIDVGGPLALARFRSRVRHRDGHEVQIKVTGLPWPELP